MYNFTFSVTYTKDDVSARGLPDIKEIDHFVQASDISVKTSYIGCVYNQEQDEVIFNFTSSDDIDYTFNDELLMREIVNSLTNIYTLRIDAIACLSQRCEETIVGGFKSNSLGSLHVYDSEMVDQINLVGSVIATSPIPPEFPDGFPQYYATREIATNEKSYKLHSHAQLRRVLQDGAYFKLYVLQTFHMKRLFIESALTREDITSVTWNSEEILTNFTPLP